MTGLVSNICKGSPSLSSPLQCCGDCGEGGILFGEGDLSGLCLSPGRSVNAGEEVGGLRVDGSPSTLVFCRCELEEVDSWLSTFSLSLFKRGDSCGLRHGGDLTTHTSCIAEQSSLLYYFCQADCRGTVVFSFHNILTQHLVHKNSIR